MDVFDLKCVDKHRNTEEIYNFIVKLKYSITVGGH